MVEAPTLIDDGQVVDDYSSKLDLPRPLETVESIDANHMQMARCRNKDDPQYRDILGVIKQFLRTGVLDRDGSVLQGLPLRTTLVGTRMAETVGELSGSASS